ncbi:MAG TPA: type I methionyl aminopeptidase [Salinisphaeraceae bacterium]|nr:type I methionyl aminopeptidase [Salinisphaeraceae bacterium]
MSIPIKTAAEQDRMRAAGRAAAQVLDMVGAHVVPGITTDELNTICHDYITGELGIESAILGYHGFPKSVCISVNHVVCHGIPGPKKLKKGDALNIDVTVIKDGFHGDSSRMYFAGKPSVLAQRAAAIAEQAMYLGIEAVRPGATLGDVGHVIQRFVENERFSVVREYCGHGIGRVFHEEPQVLHYGQAGTGVILKPGMTFTIEPMVNAGRRHVKVLPDQWTVVTKDHSLSAQWEHTILVTDEGAEILTPSQLA